MLYVFVDIKVDVQHFINTIKYNFKSGTKLAIVSTVQFLSTLQVSTKFQENARGLLKQMQFIW